jgi:SagB-type dehydrogenase family enzyme
VIRYRRSPHLVGYWQGGDLVLENYAAGRRVRAGPLVCRILDFFDGWRGIDELIAASDGLPAGSLRAAVTRLAAHSLLQRSDRAPRASEALLERWNGWKPAAAFFHFSTKDVRYGGDADELHARLRRRARRSPPPPAAKRYHGAPRLALPPVNGGGPLAGDLLARRTWRTFGREPIAVHELGTLLGLTWKVQRWIRVPGAGRVPLKTSPSGGARHPIEAYVLALRVRDLPRGLYHYAADAHALERRRTGSSARQVARYLPRQDWYGSAAAVVFMTAVFARPQWRYEHPRGYRAVLIEAGHLCQTFCLVATSLRLAPFCSMALADSRIERDLGIDGVTESVLYAAGVGARPSGIDWAPWPSAAV